MHICQAEARDRYATGLNLINITGTEGMDLLLMCTVYCLWVALLCRALRLVNSSGSVIFIFFPSLFRTARYCSHAFSSSVVKRHTGLCGSPTRLGRYVVKSLRQIKGGSRVVGKWRGKWRGEIRAAAPHQATPAPLA